jgi:hypothetical protein
LNKIFINKPYLNPNTLNYYKKWVDNISIGTNFF